LAGFQVTFIGRFWVITEVHEFCNLLYFIRHVISLKTKGGVLGRRQCLFSLIFRLPHG
jgi:hypothetical protein